MPHVDHNESWLLQTIEIETKRTRDLLRSLRHTLEQGDAAHPPKGLITELGHHASLLCRALAQATVRHEHGEPSEATYWAEHEEIIPFVERALKSDGGVFEKWVNAPDDPERRVYRDLGFSEQESQDLLELRNAFRESGQSLNAVFDHFSTIVVRQIQAGKYEINGADLLTGLAGLVAVGADVLTFLHNPGDPDSPDLLVVSVTTGLAAIWSKFSEVPQQVEPVPVYEEAAVPVRLTVENEVGQRSMFTLWLPAEPADLLARARR